MATAAAPAVVSLVVVVPANCTHKLVAANSAILCASLSLFQLLLASLCSLSKQFVLQLPCVLVCNFSDLLSFYIVFTFNGNGALLNFYYTKR